MSVTGDFTPPEFPDGTPQHASYDPDDPYAPYHPYEDRPGVPLGAAAGILVAVLALGVGAVFALGGSSKPAKTTLVAQPSVSVGLPGYTAGTSTSGASSGALPGAATSTTPAPQGTSQPTDTSTGSSSGDTGNTSSTGESSQTFYVGECVNTSGSGGDFNVSQANCSKANYKIIYAFQNESGNVDTDMSQCYTVNGNDNEFENGDSGGAYTLYCLNSLTGDYSPRRAGVDNCLDSSATYEVDCTNSRASWIVVGRLNGTTDTTGCSKFGSYDYSYYWTSSPTFVLCVDKYKRK